MISIEGVPESIARADYLRLIESVGMDINRIRSLEFRADGVYVAVKARRPGENHDILTGDGFGSNECATHRIFIPVVG